MKLSKTIRLKFAILLVSTLTVPAIAEVLPRDLDQNPSTIEAYYDTEFNITAIAHPNLAWIENFSIPDVSETDCRDGIFCNQSLPGIDRYGFMEWPTADNYVDAMNATNYLGQSNWRLPTTSFVFDARYGWLDGQHELDEILGARYSMHLPTREIFNYRFITSTYHPENGRAYVKWGSSYALGTSPADGLTRFAVWPIIDGDVGAEVATEARVFCGDFDGDGYGWNGTSSCTPTDYSFYANSIEPLQPRDLDGDLTTAEAYYHPQLEITWLANQRIAASNRFGLSNSRYYSDGSFGSTSAARDWMRRLNTSNYLGHNEWRLPGARYTYEFYFRGAQYDSEMELLAENIVALTDGSDFSLQTGNYYIQEERFTGLAARLSYYGSNYSVSVSNSSFNETYFAWPVHDGDIGTPVELEPPCIDTDGDGWGWTGTKSCKI